MAERVKRIAYREAEELYDLKSDPWCLQNIVADPSHAAIKADMKRLMEAEMRQTDDPLLPRRRRGQTLQVEKTQGTDTSGERETHLTAAS